MRSGAFDADEVATLEAMAGDGATTHEIAAALDRSETGVRAACGTRGIELAPQRRPVLSTDITKVRRLTRLGCTARMVSRLTGRSKGAIDHVRNAHDITRPAAPRRVITSVTQRCWDALTESAQRTGAPSPNRVAAVVLESASSGALDLVQQILPAPRASVPMSAMFATRPMVARM